MTNDEKPTPPVVPPPSPVKQSFELSVNWKQAAANAGVFLAILGGYLTIRGFDKDYDLVTSTKKLRAEALSMAEKQSVDQYRAHISEIRRKVIELESKIEKIDSEKIEKDKGSGVLLSDRNLELSKDVQGGLEDLNKESFRLPEALAIPVNNARAELFHRFQSKVFDRHYPDPSVSSKQLNPFFIREFDAGSTKALTEMIEK